MYNCPIRWYTVVDEMSVDEMSVDEVSSTLNTRQYNGTVGHWGVGHQPF